MSGRLGFGADLRARREALGWSLRFVADKACYIHTGMGTFNIGERFTASYLADIENGLRTPSENILQQLCTGLSLDFDDAMVTCGRLGRLAEGYIKEHPEVLRLMRLLAQHDVSADDLVKLQQRVKEGDFEPRPERDYYGRE